VRWWIKAAEQGYKSAQIDLGCAYSNGNGVPKDYVQAYIWFDLACWSYSLEPTTFFNPPPERHREDVAKFITSRQVLQARRLAIEVAKKYMTLNEIIDALVEV
jgi:uncharacterized protein